MPVAHRAAEEQDGALEQEPPNLTTQEFAKFMTESLNAILATDLQHDYFKIVEAAHFSVTPKSGSVTRFEVETMDGSNFVGVECANIYCWTGYITIVWDGLIQKDGRTTLRVTRYPRKLGAFTVEVEKSDAMVNTGKIHPFLPILGGAIYRELGL